MKLPFTAAVLALAAFASQTFAQTSETYPASYRDVVAAAKKEGKLVVYSVTSSVPALIDDFKTLYPEIQLEYVAMDTGPLHERVISESAKGRTADVVWSSAMDLQIKLVSEGYAMPYASPEAPNVPSWAIWRDEAYGSTFEPVGFVYNKELVDPSEVPTTRSELITLLLSKPEKYRNRITAFDPETSGLGYFLMTQDSVAYGPAFWNLAGVLAGAGLYPGTGSGAQFERLARGESLIGYNLLASYAMGRMKKDLPNLGVVLPKDHTLAITRVMFIAKAAAHPNAAKLWVDYVLSRRGQEILMKADLGSLRSDVPGSMAPAELSRDLKGALRPIPVDPSLLTFFDPGTRTAFLKRWADARKSSSAGTKGP